MSQVVAMFTDRDAAAAPGERRDRDLYPTPTRVCLAVLRELVDLGVLFDGAEVIEPHVGTGRWVDALLIVGQEAGHDYRITVHDIDLNPFLARFGRGVAFTHVPQGDWLESSKRLGRRYNLAIGNPPYAVVPPGQARGEVVAHHHVEACRAIADATCMVLRDGLWTASGSDERMAWATGEVPAYRWELAPRPGFTGDGRRGQFGSVAALWLDHDRVGVVRAPAGFTASKVLDWRIRGAV